MRKLLASLGDLAEQKRNFQPFILAYVTVGRRAHLPRTERVVGQAREPVCDLTVHVTTPAVERPRDTDAARVEQPDNDRTRFLSSGGANFLD